MSQRRNLSVRFVFAAILISGAIMLLLSGLFGGSVGVAQRLASLRYWLSAALPRRGVDLVLRGSSARADWSPVGVFCATLVCACVSGYRSRFRTGCCDTRLSPRAMARRADVSWRWWLGSQSLSSPRLSAGSLPMWIRQAITGWIPDWPIEFFNPIAAVRALSRPGQELRDGSRLIALSAPTTPDETRNAQPRPPLPS